MSKVLQVLAVAGLVAGVSSLGDPSGPAIDRDAALLDGYDPVTYQLGDGPEPGKETIHETVDGVVVLFASEANRAKFIVAPDLFMPAYDGHCAYGVTQGERIDSDPLVWRMVNGRLHVFFDHGIRSMWVLEEPGNKALADRLWREADRGGSGF